jgi:hypothetical protein
MKLNDENRKDGDLLPTNKKIRQKLFNEGEQRELELDENIFSNPYLEVKTLSWAQVSSTGNLFIEFEALYPERKDFIPSGIQTTKSPYWVFNFKDDNGTLNDVVLTFSIKHLLNTIKMGLKEGWVIEHTTDILPTGDINKGYLVPVMMLLREMFYITFNNIEDTLMTKKELWREYKKLQEQNRINQLLNNKRKKDE